MADTDRMREEFEAWVTSPPFEREIHRNSERSAWPGSYSDYAVDVAWKAWQAACRAQAKRDAEICRKRAAEYSHPIIKAEGLMCAEAIEKDAGL